MYFIRETYKIDRIKSRSIEIESGRESKKYECEYFNLQIDEAVPHYI